MIDIQNLSKSYGTNTILKSIHMKLDRGGIYGLVGENGAGKSTLFKCIAGRETYDGHIVSDYPSLKNKIGYLDTNPDIMSRITGWEYLKLLCVARGIKENKFDEQNIFDLPLHQYAANYSTGMKKKLALHGLLLQNNELYILDEPFNGVDIHSNMIISAIINKLQSNGKTILISSHIFSTLSDTCHEIYLLKNGIIDRRATPEHYASLESEMKDYIVGSLDGFFDFGAE